MSPPDMMIYTIDTTSLESILGGVVGIEIAVLVAVYTTCKKYGINWDLIITKLLVRYDTARMIQRQDDEMVASKLCLSDDFVSKLRDVAPADGGKINEKVIISCVRNWNLFIENYNKYQHLKPLEMKKP